ncbi:MAG: transaldolase family protein [Anaerolineales bacterium]|nr:transaldolase family protein [Anaerolineales bacterium]
MNKEPYFMRVMKQSPTEFWINNPTRRQADLAIANGATGCTNNPSYTQKMLDHPEESEYALQLLDEAVRETEDDWECAEVFQRKMVKPIAEKFMPIFERTEGARGHVSIQGDPINEDDPEIIIRDAFANRKISPNICCKIPTTSSGLKAMEVMIEENIPINATEIFGVSQMVMICEKYLEISKRTGKKPAFYMSHIAGIYDDYLRDYVEKNNIDISPDVLYQGGLAVARKVYDIMIERNYPCVFIGGGARGLQHFTEMVGGKVCITINWEGTADKLLEQDPPVVWRLFNPVPQKVIDELMEKLPDFRRGYLEDGLEVEEFEHFGPVMLFRNSFIKSWKKALQTAKERRAALVSA